MTYSEEFDSLSAYDKAWVRVRRTSTMLSLGDRTTDGGVNDGDADEVATYLNAMYPCLMCENRPGESCEASTTGPRRVHEALGILMKTDMEMLRPIGGSLIELSEGYKLQGFKEPNCIEADFYWMQIKDGFDEDTFLGAALRHFPNYEANMVTEDSIEGTRI